MRELADVGISHSLMALLACCIVCLGCIPYCVAGLKDVHHKCSSVSNTPQSPLRMTLRTCVFTNTHQCNTALATYHRSGRTEVHYQAAA